MNYPKELEKILEGREARSQLQKDLLQKHGWVVQISLNVPGIPKTIPGDMKCLLRTEERLLQTKAPWEPKERLYCENFSGKALLFGGSEGLAQDVKKVCISLEGMLPWGRILDMDVITLEGALSRQNQGMGPRQCFLCGQEAKICARLGRHSFEDLRRQAVHLVGLAGKIQ